MDDIEKKSTAIDSSAASAPVLVDKTSQVICSGRCDAGVSCADEMPRVILDDEDAKLHEETVITKSQLKAGTRMTLMINSVEYAFRWIPSGSFMMGSLKKEQSEADADGKKYPWPWLWYNDFDKEIQHKVNISRGFWMMETEITQEMWESVMGENPSYFKSSKRLPVDSISWEDCQKFISKLNDLGVNPVGFKFDLPTEAEWEYAYRAGTSTPYWFGDSLNGDKANCRGDMPFGTDKKGAFLQKTTEVGKYPANAWGLYDMCGNVCEWTSDWYGDYPTGEVTDPTGPEGGAGRVIRGGGWVERAVKCRAACRFEDEPDYHGFCLGARLALRLQ